MKIIGRCDNDHLVRRRTGQKTQEKHLTKAAERLKIVPKRADRINNTTMADTEQTHQIKMRPRARIIGLIGEELISDEEAALVELVKNAYDADASEVVITFHNSITDVKTIEIEDNGCGMTADAIQSGWFEPGASKKRTLGYSEGGRVLLGAKGIGRFAAAKLGRFFKVKTKSSKNNQEIEVNIDWKEFESDNYLDSVNSKKKKKNGGNSSVGTTLIIEGINSIVWNENKYKNLMARLNGLISPNFIENKKFTIKIRQSSYSKLETVTTPTFFEEPRYLCQGRVIKNNNEYKITGSVIAKGFDGKPYNDKIEDIVEADECGTFEFKITAWDRDKASLDLMVDAKDSLSAKNIKKMLDAYCGVRIYRDGFRIFPYGGQGNDWLSLDQRNRQNPTLRLSNSQVIGSILITNDCNEGLIDRSSREGLKHNVAYYQLVDIVHDKIMPKIELIRYNIRPRNTSQYKIQSLIEAKNSINNELANIKHLLKSPKDRQEFDISKKAITEDIKQIQNMFSIVVPAAGLGVSAKILLHEIGSPVNGITDTSELLKISLKKDLKINYKKEYQNDFNDIQNYAESLSKMHHAYEHSFKNFGEPVQFLISQKINSCLEFYNTLIKKQKIELNYHPNSLEVYMEPTALLHILLNLLDNAIYWIAEKNGAGKGGKIKIEVEEKNNGYCITLFDDGIGITEEEEHLIFNLGYSKKTSGTGLGLYICRELVGNYGTVKISERVNSLGGAAFEVFIQRKEKKNKNE